MTCRVDGIDVAMWLEEMRIRVARPHPNAIPTQSLSSFDLLERFDRSPKVYNPFHCLAYSVLSLTSSASATVIIALLTPPLALETVKSMF